jgi:hypothetical protein
LAFIISNREPKYLSNLLKQFVAFSISSSPLLKGISASFPEVSTSISQGFKLSSFKRFFLSSACADNNGTTSFSIAS